MSMSRRELIKRCTKIGATGWMTNLILPWISDAYGVETGAANRFALFYSHFGWQTWSGWKRNSDTDFTLPKNFDVLGKYKQDLTLVSGLYQDRNPRGKPHGVHWHLGAGADNQGPSLDRFIGSHIGKNHPYSAIHVNTWTRSGNGAPKMAQPITDGGMATRKIAPWTKPSQTHAALFNGNKQVETVDILSRRGSVLDFLNGQISKMNRNLAAAEKTKLDQFTQAVRDVEKRIARLGDSNSSCGVDSPGNDGGSNFSQITEATIIQAQLAGHALACGLTPSAAIGVDRNWNASVFGMGNVDNHKMQHKGPMNALDACQQWRFRNIKEMLDVLSTYAEGDGTVADRTVSLYTDSSCFSPGNGHHQGVENMSLAVFGNAGGQFKPGRWLFGRGLMDKPVVSTRSQNRPPAGPNDPDTAMNEVYLACAQAVGVKVDSYGDPKHCRGPMKGMFA